MGNENRFDWIPFYQEFANELLKYKDNRKQLGDIVSQLPEISGVDMPTLKNIETPITDIDPFTVFSLFNTKGNENEDKNKEDRINIIRGIKKVFQLSEEIPTSLDGIPTNNRIRKQNTIYYNIKLDNVYKKEKQIDILWNLFDAAIKYVNDTTSNRDLVKDYFDQVININGDSNGKITDGLFWIAPDAYLNLDNKNVKYIYSSGKISEKVVNDFPKLNSQGKLPQLSADQYFDIVDKIKAYLQSIDSDFCELSYEAYQYDKKEKEDKENKSTANAGAEVLSEEHAEINKGSEIDDVHQAIGGSNILYYGVPGAGKSHKVNEKLKDEIGDDGSKVERVVFHPDYTYSDFVGQILPKCVKGEGGKDDKLEYSFTPGPFTRILSEAISDPGNKYFLVIEEINRGNAPAIFGDIFQLLDRNENGKGKYSITNSDIADYVYENMGDEAIADYKDKNGDHKVRIPANLTLYATMNTSDQNVFTLDTAFQRRWDMQLIFNKIDAKHANQPIGNSTITWGAFVKVINDKILDENRNMISSEDKRLGAYFMTKSELEEDNRRLREDNDYRSKFAEKVLKYLWDDAFKMNRDEVFNKNFKSLEDVISKYEGTKTEDPLKVVLKEEIYSKMSQETNEPDIQGNNEKNQD